MTSHHTHRTRWLGSVLAGLLLGFWAAVATAGPPSSATSAAEPARSEPRDSDSKSSKQADEEPSYLRLRRDEDGTPIAMDVAIVRFEPAKRNKKSPVVDLIGAVHVAQPEYFDKLNKSFADYDAVLYELIAPEGTRPDQDASARTTSPLSAFQKGLTDLLDLEFQLDGIDYQAANLIHADMSPDEFAQSMRDRGETVWSMFARMLTYSMLKQNGKSKASDMELLMALLSKNRALALKRAMARQFQDLGGVVLALEGPGGSTLIGDRNAKALDVLRRELDGGKQKVAIFYGAGHMPDMAKRLEKDFALRPTDTRWLMAWDMAEPKRKPDKKPAAGSGSADKATPAGANQ